MPTPPHYDEPQLKRLAFWRNLSGWIAAAFLLSGSAVSVWGLSVAERTGDIGTVCGGLGLCAFFIVPMSLMTWFGYRWKRVLLLPGDDGTKVGDLSPGSLITDFPPCSRLDDPGGGGPTIMVRSGPFRSPLSGPHNPMEKTKVAIVGLGTVGSAWPSCCSITATARHGMPAGRYGSSRSSFATLPSRAIASCPPGSSRTI